MASRPIGDPLLTTLGMIEGIRIVRGEYGRIRHVRKFGHNPDAGTGAEDIWNQGGDYNFPSSAVTLYASSSSTNDTGDTIQVFGLDSDYNEQTGYVTLTGQTQAEIKDANGDSITFIRVHRAYNTGSVEIEGDVYIAQSDTLSSGVPQTATKIHAKLVATVEQTEMAIYTIPDGYKGYIVGYWASINRGSGGSDKEADLQLEIREFGATFRGRVQLGLTSVGESYVYHPLPLPIEAPAKADVRSRSLSSTASTELSSGFDIVLVAD